MTSSVFEISELSDNEIDSVAGGAFWFDAGWLAATAVCDALAYKLRSDNNRDVRHN